MTSPNFSTQARTLDLHKRHHASCSHANYVNHQYQSMAPPDVSGMGDSLRSVTCHHLQEEDQWIFLSLLTSPATNHQQHTTIMLATTTTANHGPITTHTNSDHAVIIIKMDKSCCHIPTTTADCSHNWSTLSSSSNSPRCPTACTSQVPQSQHSASKSSPFGKRTDIANAKPSSIGVLQDLEDRHRRHAQGADRSVLDACRCRTLQHEGLLGKASSRASRAPASTISCLGRRKRTHPVDMAVAEAFTVPASSPYTYQVAITRVHRGPPSFLRKAVATSAHIGDPDARPIFDQRRHVHIRRCGRRHRDRPITATRSPISCSYPRQSADGSGPVFEFNAKQDYFVQGIEKKLIIKLNACRSSKWSLPFKNTDYTIQDFEFTAFADPNNNRGTFAFSE